MTENVRDTLSFSERKADLVARILSSHNLPSDRARELLEPVKTQKVC